VYELLTYCIGSALIPIGAFLGLFSRHDFDETIGEGIEAVGGTDMSVQRGRIELGQNKYSVDTGMDAIADRDIDQAVFAADRHDDFERYCVSGNSREPRPPPNINPTTSPMANNSLTHFTNRKRARNEPSKYRKEQQRINSPVLLMDQSLSQPLVRIVFVPTKLQYALLIDPRRPVEEVYR